MHGGIGGGVWKAYWLVKSELEIGKFIKNITLYMVRSNLDPPRKGQYLDTKNILK